MRQPALQFVFTSLLLVALGGTCPAGDEPTPAADTSNKVEQRTIDFSRDIRPILSDNCCVCHGFDESSRQADLRLDSFEGACADLGGYAAIVPGKPEKSRLIERVTSTDASELMPPKDSHRKPLSAQSIALLTEWIRQGAVWGKHWSFVKPVKADVPTTSHPIDYFVTQRLRQTDTIGPFAGQLAPRAEPHTLARRLSFDLLGLPATTAQIESLRTQPDDGNWNELVDELLESPHFGERMSMWWLDGARYSDTDGFQQDAVRSNWPWRDWVIAAFNDNMPFDQFTIEQFAGDLLPNASDAQQLATCFHRNHMHNGEGGREAEESRVDYVLDRVNTMGTLWLGLTLGCTQCHDHKFDPISQRDYYSLSAYFNSIDETGEAGAKAEPFMKWKSPLAARDVAQNEGLLKQLEQEVARHRAAATTPFETWLQRQADLVRADYRPWRPVHIASLKTTEGYHLSSEEDGLTITSQASPLPQDDFLVSCAPPKNERITAIRLDVLPHVAHTDGKLSFAPSGEFILTNFKLRLRRIGSSQYRELEIAGAVADVDGKGQDEKYAGVVGTLDDDPRTGWTTRNHPADAAHWAMFELAEPLVMAEDEQLDIILMQRSIENRELIGRFRLSYTDQRGVGIRSRAPMPIDELANYLASSPDALLCDIPSELRAALFDQYLEDDSVFKQLALRLDLVQGQYQEAQKSAKDLQVTVLRERSEPRQTFVLARGVWDSHADEVKPGVLPAVLPFEPSAVPSRLELGRWIVSSDNPLTARVIVNQVWQLFFGAGLVRTPNDFGLQGEQPTHPELLDWLAVDFVQSGWDLKHLVRTIVSSETYRQSSSTNPQQRELDPENRLLSRGSRFRLPAWMIRDSRLAFSGQLIRDLGGPPIFPYQPEGVWKDQFMGRLTYQPTLGPGQYRRTIYAFWRRSSAPAFLFDSAMRRNCEVTQYRTNTPLHALNLLNDLTGQEAARSLADKFMPASAVPSRSNLADLWYHLLGRPATQREMSLLDTQYRRAREYYQQDLEAAAAVLSVGQLTSPAEEQLADRAALMAMATMILNLDECITHE